MNGQLLHEYLRPAGLSDLYDIGKLVMSSLADDVKHYFPKECVAPDVSWQVESLISGHEKEQLLRQQHQLALAWLKQCGVTTQ